jgi:hypothetical protein
MKLARGFGVAALGVALLAASSPAVSQDPTAARVAAIKQWVVESKEHLKGYQWIETTVVSHDGDVKSTTTTSCFYDVTGALQKVPMASSPEPKKKPGIRGAIQKDEQKEMSDYMKNAVALVKSYFPPNVEKIQASKDAGKMSVDFLPGGQNMKLNFKDYEKPGDVFSVSLDPNTNKLLGMGVATYIDNAKDAVVLDVTLSTLPDGTGYASKINLDAKAKKLNVTVTNTGYRKSN